MDEFGKKAQQAAGEYQRDFTIHNSIAAEDGFLVGAKWAQEQLQLELSHRTRQAAQYIEETFALSAENQRLVNEVEQLRAEHRSLQSENASFLMANNLYAKQLSDYEQTLEIYAAKEGRHARNVLEKYRDEE